VGSKRASYTPWKKQGFQLTCGVLENGNQGSEIKHITSKQVSTAMSAAPDHLNRLINSYSHCHCKCQTFTYIISDLTISGKIVAVPSDKIKWNRKCGLEQWQAQRTLCPQTTSIRTLNAKYNRSPPTSPPSPSARRPPWLLRPPSLPPLRIRDCATRSLQRHGRREERPVRSNARSGSDRGKTVRFEGSYRRLERERETAEMAARPSSSRVFTRTESHVL
jgi:hypothetical protein